MLCTRTSGAACVSISSRPNSCPARACWTQVWKETYRRRAMVRALQALGSVISARSGRRAGCSTVSTPAAAASAMLAVITDVQNRIMRRADSAPHCAESSSLWNSSSSTAASSTRATRSRYSSVATRNTLGSSRPVPAVDADRSSAPTIAVTATTTNAGTASRSRSVVSPPPSNWPSTRLTATSPTACATPPPNSATATRRRARGSARWASRMVAAISRGIRATMFRRPSSRKDP